MKRRECLKKTKMYRITENLLVQKIKKKIFKTKI